MQAWTVTVSPGWRVRIDVSKDPKPVTVSLPPGAKTAGILDPETVVEHRANIEWGETPKRQTSDIGRVIMADDKLSFTFEPGSSPEGIVYVLFEQEQTPQAAQLTVGGQARDLAAGKNGRVWKEGELSVVFDPGTVVVPPPTEAARLGMVTAPMEDKALLCSLGYIHDGCDEL